MVVLDQFYQIAEAAPSRVSLFWKVAHTASCILCAFCGIATAFTFGRVLDNFSYNCILSANIVFDNTTYLNGSTFGHNEAVRAVDLASTVWGHHDTCNFAQFTPLVSMITAIIWGTYFVVMSRGGAGYATDLLSKPWSILYPCFFFTLIFFIVYVISVGEMKYGMEGFCAQFHPEFNTTECVPKIDVYIAQFSYYRNSFFNTYPNIIAARWSADIGTWSWIFQMVLCVVRVFCSADFDLQLVTVLSKEEERVEKIVEFTDDGDIDIVSQV